MRSTPQAVPIFAAVALGLLFFGMGGARSACAEETDPFQMDAGVWKSFDRYKEEQKEKLVSSITGDPDNDAKAAAEAERAETEKAEEVKASAAAAAEKPAVVIAATPAIAVPDRPLDAPVMPGFATRPSIAVSSTMDDAHDDPSVKIAHIDADPDLQIAKHDWVTPAKAEESAANGGDGDDLNAPLNVRMTMLPSYKALRLQRKAQIKQVAAVLPAPAPVVDPQACAAVDAYKKRELEAIQSDRHTLAALEAAISELGLNKQLSFMTDTTSKINFPSSSTASAQNMTNVAP